MKEIYNQQIEELNQLIQSKQDIEHQIATKIEKINQNLNDTLVGKFFKREINNSKWARIGNSEWNKPIGKLYEICQVLKVDSDSIYIQEYCEHINEVTPYRRLTFDCSFASYKTSNFFECYGNEPISLEEFVSWIKVMQERDSYSCWHTTLRVK